MGTAWFVLLTWCGIPTMDLTRLCENDTPLVVEPIMLDDPSGHELVVAMAKLTWLVSASGEARIAIPSRPVRVIAVQGGDERHTAFDYPSDAVNAKPGTDVILLGQAYPSKPGVTEQRVSLRVEAGARSIEKAVKVFGTRVFAQTGMGNKILPGKPQPLQVTPLVYQLAYGGTDATAAEPIIDWTNPVGIGVRQNPKELVGSVAYAIELDGGTAPAGFGPLEQHWSPRRERAGTFDEAWAKTRMPILPVDFDPKHHLASHPDLWSEVPLAGDEPVEIVGATPEGAWRFQLPRYAPRFSATVAGETKPLETHLDTFLIDITDPQWRVVELTWRAAVRLPRKSEMLKSIQIVPDAVLPDAIYQRLEADIALYREANPAEENDDDDA